MPQTAWGEGTRLLSSSSQTSPTWRLCHYWCISVSLPLEEVNDFLVVAVALLFQQTLSDCLLYA